MTVSGLVVVLAGATAVLVLVAAAQGGLMSRPLLFSLASLCGLGLLVMLVTDWPLGVLSRFWADHSVISAVLSTLLLVGVGFLAFEAHDSQVQSHLDESVTAAGMSGVVDHVVDIEVALALASAPNRPDERTWPGWSDPEIRPLRWLREGRKYLASEGGRPSASDPRGFLETELRVDTDVSWRQDLLDQAVRRVIGALRDWAGVIGRSRNGQMAMVDLGKVRVGVLAAQAKLRDGRIAEALRAMTQLRSECRILALALERGGRSGSVRPEVLLTFEPLPADAISAPKRAWIHRSLRAADSWKSLRETARRDLSGPS
jgi:hypothetical protein